MELLKSKVKDLIEQQQSLLTLYKKLTKQVSENEKLLEKKCSKSKCKKISEKVQKLEKKTSEKHQVLKDKLSTLNKTKCSFDR